MNDNNDNVFALPGVDLDAVGSVILPAEQVLQAALEAGLTDVVVVGRKPNMRSYVAFSDPNLEALLGKLDIAKMAVMDAMLTFDGDYDEYDDHGA